MCRIVYMDWLQWGRGNLPRITGSTRDTMRDRGLLQWGRGNLPRITSLNRDSCVLDARFNGAAAICRG